MNPKRMLYTEEAREKLRLGVDKLANAVKISLGGRGRNALFKTSWGTVNSTKDGVSIARQIFLKDEFENIGAQMVKEAANRTVVDAGDGTSTSCVLAQAFFAEGLKKLSAGFNPIDIKNGMEKASKIVISELNKRATQVESSKDIENIGTISANDPAIGKLIADAMDKVGKNGVINIETSPDGTTFLEVKKGMIFDRGYITPYFVNNAEKVQVELSECYIFLYDGRLENIKEMEPILQEVSRQGKSILFIAEDYGQTFLSNLIANKQRGALLSCPVKAPGYGERRKEILKDLAVLTGGSVVGNEAGLTVKNFQLDDFGTANKVIVNRGSTTIVGGGGTKEELKSRIKQIEDDIKNVFDEYDREKMRERLAKLCGGVANIRVGAPTETEQHEIRDRVEDAISATKAAVLEGVLPGGGIALLRCKPLLESLCNKMENEGEKEGARVVLNSLDIPIKIILSNSGAKSDIIVEKILEHPEYEFGYNVVSRDYENLIDTGVIDPKKVVRCAFQNAISVSTLLLITEVVIVDEDEVKTE